MKLKTRDFGEIEITENEIFHFTQPIFGFESYPDYAILQDEEIGDKIVWLQSIDEPGLCFILMDPSGLSDIFNPVLPEDSLKLLGEGDWLCWGIAVVSDDVKQTSINLKSPIFINTTTHLAAQIILEQDYPVRYMLSKGGKQ